MCCSMRASRACSWAGGRGMRRRSWWRWQSCCRCRSAPPCRGWPCFRETIRCTPVSVSAVRPYRPHRMPSASAMPCSPWVPALPKFPPAVSAPACRRRWCMWISTRRCLAPTIRPRWRWWVMRSRCCARCWKNCAIARPDARSTPACNTRSPATRQPIWTAGSSTVTRRTSTRRPSLPACAGRCRPTASRCWMTAITPFWRRNCIRIPGEAPC